MPDHTPARPRPPSAAADTHDAAEPADGFADEEADDGPWRHAPVAPKDEGIARSIGKSIADVVTGPLDDADGKPKTPST